MFTESDGVDAGGLIEAAALIGVAITPELMRQLGIPLGVELQSAFDAMVPVSDKRDWEPWL